ncbi:MAG TPA: ATPase domain-containing protein [Myxococcaceae bacterium]|jgi:circadian clock protein KaiC
MTENTSSNVDRLTTGISGLDTLLHGGFVKGAVYMVLGMPGAGKTILANQLCFHHVFQGGRALYVTLLAESHTRMISNLRPMKFFDASRISDSLVYLSAYSVLEEGGLDALLELIRKEVKAQKATLLILDGLVAAEEVAPTEVAFKRFIHGVQVTTAMVNCTSLLLTTGSGKGLNAEHTMVDGLLMLRERTSGVRSVRELSIRKFRGSGHYRGQHSFDITPNGIVVYPRLEALIQNSIKDVPTDGRRGFGIKRLDEMLDGGLFQGSSTMLFGTSGSGKTLLGLHFLAEGARQKELSHYFAFYDTPTRVCEQTSGVGLHLEPLIKKGYLELSFRPPTESSLDMLGMEIVTLIRERGVRRLFIDGFDALSKAATRKARIGQFMAALVNECRSRGVAMLFTAEAQTLFGYELKFPVRGISMISENIFFMRTAEVGTELRNFISVLKLRNSGHDRALREFRISKKGLEIGDPLVDAQMVLTGIPMSSSPAGGARKKARKGLFRGRGR